MYRKFGKRALDILLSFCGIIILSPLYLLIALAIKIDDPGPAFFFQKRVGLHKTHFRIMKFRTMKMSSPHDVPTHLLENPEQHITRVGRILRKTSLDELPQIFQILTGKMSVIGPRPLLVKYLPYYSEEERVRHCVRPGLSGLAQVNGRNAISWEEKFAYDVSYVNHITFLCDAKILMDTVKKVFVKSEGIVLNALEDFDEYRKHDTVV